LEVFVEVRAARCEQRLAGSDLADEGGDDGAGGAGDSVGGAGEDADDRVDEATEDGNSHVRYSFLEGGVASIK
jgi:hypothetical protein